MIVGLSIGATVLRSVLIFLGRAVGWVIVFGSGARVKAAALRVDTSVATLCAREEEGGRLLRLKRVCFHFDMILRIDPPRHSWRDHRIRELGYRLMTDHPGCSCVGSDWLVA